MRSLSIRVLVVMALAIAAPGDAAETPVCERRLVGGETYACIAEASDPAGICSRRCVTVVDTVDGFDLQVAQGLGAPYVLHCGCALPESNFPGPRWFTCVDDGVDTLSFGKVTAAGRRIRRGFTSYQDSAWTDDYTCVRSTSCIPEFGPCSQFGVE